MTEKQKSARKYTPAVHESIDKYLAAIRYLTEHKIPFSDKTPFGGALWVFITDPESKQIADLAATSGLKFCFSQKGGAASHNNPAWYYRASSDSKKNEEKVLKQDKSAPTPIIEDDADLQFAVENNPKWKWDAPADDSRIRRALELPKSSITIDATHETATMESEPDRKTGEIKSHTVTLTNCSCQDFRINCRGEKPCKHIIRLAMELGIINEHGVTPEQQIKDDIQKLQERIALAYGMYHLFDSKAIPDDEYDDLKERLAKLRRTVRK